MGAASGTAAAQGAAPVQARDALPYLMGQPMKASLPLGVIALEGQQQPSEVYANTQDGATWHGTALLDAGGRIQIRFDTVLVKNVPHPVVASAYDQTGLPGLSASIKNTSSSQAANILSGFLTGFKTFTQSLLSQQNVTIQGAGASSLITSSAANTPNFWLTTAGSALGAVQVPQSAQNKVVVGQIQKDTPIMIVVGENAQF